MRPIHSIVRSFRGAFLKVGSMEFAAASDIDQGAFQKIIALAHPQRE